MSIEVSYQRKFQSPAPEVWDPICNRIQQLTELLNGLNENQPEKGDPALKPWDEQRKNLRRAIINCHEEKIKLLQSCYKERNTK